MREIRKLASFALVGGGVFVAGQLALRLLVSGLWWNAAFANAAVQLISVWFNYQLNQKHTWSGMTGHNQANRFIVARIMSTLLSLGLFHVFTTAGMHYQLASALGVIAGMVVNYIASDLWVFRPGHVRTNTDLTLGWQTTFVVAASLIVAVLVLRIEMTQLFLPILLVSLAVVTAIAAVLYLTVLVYGHRDDLSYKSLTLREPTDVRKETFAVLMPARREDEMYARTILNAFLTQIEHGKFRLIPVICSDDTDTIRVAMTAARLINHLPVSRGQHYDKDALEAELEVRLSQLRFDNAPLGDADNQSLTRWRSADLMVQVVVFPLAKGQKPSKPLQLNYALETLGMDQYSLVTILDAESQAQPGLFGYIDQAFQDNPDVDVFQGPVQLMDPVYRGTRLQKLRQRVQQWYSWHNLLEYYRLNAGQMPFQQDNKFVPLCGNTLFIRTNLLKNAGGWPLTLTEDCALGVLLTSRFKANVRSFYMPRIATREETPPTASDLVKQRTRWTQGFLQSLIQGEWRALPTRRQRLLALWILTSPFTQAATTPLLILTVMSTTFELFISPPIMVLVMFVPLLAMFVVVALQLSQLHDFGRDYGRHIPWYAYVQVVVTLIPYQAILGYAAIRAVWRHFSGNIDWHSPARTGDHLSYAPTVLEASK